MSKLPPELLQYEDWFERSARFYPNWTLTAAAAYFQNPDAPGRLSDLSVAVRGLYMSLNDLTKAVHDKPAAIEIVWSNAAKAIKAMRLLASKADDVVSDAMKMSDFPLVFAKQKGRLHNRLKGIVADYTKLIAPLGAVGVPLARTATLESLRSATIRLASKQPKGSAERRALLNVLKADDAETGWDVMLQTRKLVKDENLDVPDEYSQQVTLLKALKAGDKVTITYHDSQRGGEVKTSRIVSMSWSDLKAEHPESFKKPQALLEAKGAGALKRGMLADFGRRDGVVWQGTMRMKIKAVIKLQKG